MKQIKRSVSLALMSFLLFSCVPLASAQEAKLDTPAAAAPQDAKVSLDGRVLDPNKAFIVGAEITVTDAAGQDQVIKTDDSGQFHLGDLKPGTYSVLIYSDGYVKYENKTLRLPLKEPLSVVMKIDANATINVTDSAAVASLDPEKNGSAIVLTPEDLQSLPDDPDDLLAALKDLAGPASGIDDANVYVDGFLERGRIPPKEAILRVTINNSPYSAEFAEPGFGRIQIITKPGTDLFHAYFNFNLGNSIFDARNAFALTRPKFDQKRLGGSLNGPIIKGKSSFFFDYQRRTNNSEALINALVPGAGGTPTSFIANVLTPSSDNNFTIRTDFLLNPTNTLMFSYRFNDAQNMNQGVGGFALPEHGADSHSRNNQLRISETDLINNLTVNQLRIQIDRTNSLTTALSNAPQIVIPQFFTGGGAQGSLFSRPVSNALDFHDDIAYTPKNHALKGGFEFFIDNNSTFNMGNYGGTFTFNNIQQYEDALNGVAGARAVNFSVSSGIPSFNATEWRYGVFLLDDWKVRQNFTLSYGVRDDFQTHLKGMHLAPRLSFAWSPFTSQSGSPSTVIRGGFGIFNSRLNVGALATVGQADGLHQVSINIPCASFTNPQPSDALNCPQAFQSANFPHGIPAGNSLPITRLFQGDLKLPYTEQWSIGVDRNLPLNLFASVNFIWSKAVDAFRSFDINQPVPGQTVTPIVVPFPNQGPIYQVESNGNFKRKALQINVRRQLSRSFTFFGNYTYARAYSDYAGGNGTASGIFSLPYNSYDPEADYAETDGGIHHSVNFGGSINAPWGVRISPSINYRSAGVFNIVTPIDYLGDQIRNQRPAFVTPGITPNLPVITPFGTFDLIPKTGETIIPRNFGTTTPTFTTNLSFSKTIGWGEPRSGGWTGGNGGGGNGGGGGGRGGGGGGRGGGGGGRGGGGGETSHLYNMTFGLFANNIFNNVNFSNYNGQLTDPKFPPPPIGTGHFATFGEPNSAGRARTVEFQMRFSW